MTSGRGRPKGDKRERTRAALVDAAAQVIGEKGFEGTSLDAVARRAGMTRGAIYGNFRDRDELFLAVVESRWRPITPQFEPGASFAEQMTALGQAVIESLAARRAAAVGAASFSAYVLTHEAMRERLVQMNAEIYREMAEAISASITPLELPMPAEALVRVLHGLIEGLVGLSNLTPELIDARVIADAFAALGRIRPA